MARKVLAVSALTVALEGTNGDEEGVLDVHAVVLPRGRMLMAKRAFSTSMTDRRGPMGADDDGEGGVCTKVAGGTLVCTKVAGTRCNYTKVAGNTLDFTKVADSTYRCTKVAGSSAISTKVPAACSST